MKKKGPAEVFYKTKLKCTFYILICLMTLGISTIICDLSKIMNFFFLEACVLSLLMVFVGDHPGKPSEETIYRYRSLRGQIYYPHDFIGDVWACYSRKLLGLNEVLSFCFVSILIFLVYKIFSLLVLVFIPFLLYWLGEYFSCVVLKEEFAFKVKDWGFINTLSALAFSLVYTFSLNTKTFLEYGLVNKIVVSRICGFPYFLFLNLSIRLFWIIHSAISSIKWSTKYKVIWPYLLWDALAYDLNILIKELHGSLKIFSKTHRIYWRGGKKIYNPSKLTIAVDLANEARSMRIASKVVNSSGIMAGIGSNSYESLLYPHKDLCSVRVMGRVHLANKIFYSSDGKILLNIYTSGKAIRKFNPNLHNEPVISRNYEEDVYTQAGQEKYMRLALVYKDSVSSVEKAGKIVNFYTNDSHLGPKILSIHDTFKSIVTLNEGETKILGHDKDGYPDRVISKNRFSVDFKKRFKSEYAKVWNSMYGLAEEDVNKYLSQNPEVKVDAEEFHLACKELAHSYIEEVRSIPTTVFQESCAFSIAKILAPKDTLKYAEILTHLKQNSIH